MNLFILLLIVLACARITHLLADDFLLDRPRTWLVTHSPGQTLPYLWTCTWCMSIWVAIGGALVAHYHAGVDDWGTTLLLVPALSYTTVMLEALVERLYGGDD